MSSQTPTTQVMLHAADLLEKKFAHGWGDVRGGKPCDDLAEALARRKRLAGMCAITAFHVAALDLIADEKEAKDVADLAVYRFATRIGVEESHAGVWGWHDEHDKETVVRRVREAATA